jgi:predicted mannosyl-3-phosphoglycerate phosphatase (HAD superfamily)
MWVGSRSLNFLRRNVGAHIQKHIEELQKKTMDGGCAKNEQLKTELIERQKQLEKIDREKEQLEDIYRCSITELQKVVEEKVSEETGRNQLLENSQAAQQDKMMISHGEASALHTRSHECGLEYYGEPKLCLGTSHLRINKMHT